MMISKTLMEDILAGALQNGGDFAEVYLEDRTVNNLVNEEHKLESAISGRTVGAGIRLVLGERTYYAYCSTLDPQTLLGCARSVSRALREERPGLLREILAAEPAVCPEGRIAPDGVDSRIKQMLLSRADQSCWAVDGRIRQVKAVYGDLSQHVEIANSLGQFVEDHRVRTKLIVQALARNDDGVVQTGYDAEGSSSGFEFIQGLDVEALARRAARRALLMLDARRAPAGRMPVVMGAEAGGTMVHEACGHGLEADLVLKKMSVYAGRIGEKVASDKVTVLDDGTLAGRYGTDCFDDEGTRTHRNMLIENGVLKGYMADRLSAGQLGIAQTGNGRRESFRHKPITRMTNTMIAPGTDDPARIIGDTRRGLYVARMGGGQVNTANGDFVFEVSEGYLIEGGEITVPVRGATLTGNGPVALQKVDRVGSDLGYAIGTCGKDGQGVPVADAQPTIRIPELVVGGVIDEEN